MPTLPACGTTQSISAIPNVAMLAITGIRMLLREKERHQERRETNVHRNPSSHLGSVHLSLRVSRHRNKNRYCQREQEIASEIVSESSHGEHSIDLLPGMTGPFALEHNPYYCRDDPPAKHPVTNVNRQRTLRCRLTTHEYRIQGPMSSSYRKVTHTTLESPIKTPRTLLASHLRK